MTSLLVLTLLAQADYPVPLGPGLLPVHGSAPRAAFNGNEYVVTWVDDRLDALRARRIDDSQRHDVWRTSFPPGGPPRGTAPVCEAQPTGPLALAASSARRQVDLYWTERQPNQVLIRHAVVAGDGGVSCPPPLYEPASEVSGLAAAVTGTSTALAWKSATDSRAYLVWLGPDGGVAQGPGGPSNTVSEPARLSLAPLTIGVRLAFTDPAGVLPVININIGQTSGTSNSLAGVFDDAVLEPQGGFVLASASALANGQYQAWVPLAFTPSATLDVALGARQAEVVSSVTRRSGMAVERAGETWFQPFALDAGVWPATRVVGELEPALATNGAGALLVTTTTLGSELRLRTPGLEPTGLQLDAGYRHVGDAPPTQRRPSVARLGNRWLIVYEEEEGPSGFGGRYVTFSEDAGFSMPSALSLANPALTVRPGGAVVWRGDVGGQTQSSNITLSGTGGVIASSPSLSSAPSTSGAATDLEELHWTESVLYSTAPGGSTGRSLPSTERPFRTSASVTGGVFIPFVTRAAATPKGSLWYVTNAELASGPGLLQPLVPFPPRDVAPDVVPALAAKDASPEPLIFWAWVDSQQPAGDLVGYQVSTLSQPPFIGTIRATRPPVRALAVAPSGAGWVLFVLDGNGLTATFITDDGLTAGIQGWPAPPAGVQLGEPVAASSPTGEVAVVFPVFEPAALSVQLHARLLPPFAWPGSDAGVRDAGMVDAGLPVDAGSGDAGPPDAGTAPGDGGPTSDAGPMSDAGTADAGPGQPLEFTTYGCACTTSAGDAGAWLLALLALFAGRRAARR